MMNKIETIKQYTNWTNVIEIQNSSYLIYYVPTINIKQEINNVKGIYTSSDVEDYIIVESEIYCYLGEIVNNEILCFAKTDSLQEACEAL